jgi:iron complex transport system substrate-binding protein
VTTHRARLARTAFALRVAALLQASLSIAVCAAAESTFLDDAQRTVALPERVERVFAAGAPAEVLLYTLVPDKLVGRNHPPSAAALELTPPEYRRPVQITNLPDRDDARYDAELLALRPDVYVDYGDVEEDYVAALEAVTARTRIPGIILDGRLTNLPSVYRRLGAALGVAERGERLASAAERILGKYRGALSGSSVRAYLACSQNGLSPCLAKHSFGEAAELLGAHNVAGSSDTAPRRPLTLEEVRVYAPTVIVAASKASAAMLRTDSAWRGVAAAAAGHIHAPPDVPFNWGPRPPSVNRLLGMIWLAYVLPERPFDDAFYADVARFFAEFYHFEPTRAQLDGLLAE